MSRRASPGIGQWVTVSLMVAAAIFLLVKLYQYALFQNSFPTGLTIAGIDVSNMTSEQASELLTNRYIEAPIIVYHGEQSFEIPPAQAKFELGIESMLSQAEFQRDQQDFWAGFWGFLWGRPVEIEAIPIVATHDREALGEVLSDIALLMDKPAQPPQPVPATLSFQYGDPGTQTNITASFDDVERALYRASNREAHLVIEPVDASGPDKNLLARLLVNYLQDFETQTGAVASVYILDLSNGEEVTVNADIAMSGIDLMKVPIALETFRTIDRTPTLTQRRLLSETLVTQVEHFSANDLLAMVSGADDPYVGADMVTNTLQRLGLTNSFITTPYDSDSRPGQETAVTPANSVELLRTSPTPEMQTTAEDMGLLLSMIYYCAQGQGGTLRAIYGNQLSQAECQQLLEYMRQNRIGSLLEAGIPQGTAVAHRHGWISDTHGDAGIIFSPAGEYVIVEMLYKDNWLEWELSSPLLADISRATYNFFNFDNPYLTNLRAN